MKNVAMSMQITCNSVLCDVCFVLGMNRIFVRMFFVLMVVPRMMNYKHVGDDVWLFLGYLCVVVHTLSGVSNGCKNGLFV